MKNFILILFCLLPSFIHSNNAKRFIDENFAFAKKQMNQLSDIDITKNGYPRTLNPDGSLKLTYKNDWTEGFFPGSLWYVFEADSSSENLDNALKWTAPLENLQYLKSHHDIGFLMYCSYGNAYRLTGNEAYKSILIESAKSLCSRFDSKTGVIKSWDYRESWDRLSKWYYPVIIDNMMNLELLYAVSKITGDESFANIATKHAEVTLKNHIRPDFGTYHVINYDPNNGDVLFSGTCQGYSDESTWSRGQAWAIYGFTMVYRETKDKRFLDAAISLSEYWLNHPNMPKDLVPFWDFNVVDKDMQPADWAKKQAFEKEIPPRDASAAAVTCSALFELSTYVDKKRSKRYYKAAEKTLKSLASPQYRAQLGTNGGFILKHSVGSIPHGVEIDVPLVYADYYFLEALHRYKNYNNIK